MSSNSSSSSSASSQSSASAESTTTTTTTNYCGDGKKRIQLVPSFQQRFIINATDGFRLKVEAKNPCGMEAEIFRYYRYPAAQIYGGKILDEFTGVCSWADLVELPKNAPLPNASPAAFRLDFFDVVLRSEALAYEAWELVKKEVDHLVQTLIEGEKLQTMTPHWSNTTPT